MPRVKSVNVSKDDIKFSYTVNVDKGGIFSTTLPEDAVALFKDAQLKMGYNRLRREGYFEDPTLDGLQDQIKAILDEYCSREVKYEEVVLRYAIQVTCSYCTIKDKEGMIYPNGYFAGKDYEWKEGTLTQNSANAYPYGFLVYVKPKVKRTYSYKSGKEKTEYEQIEEHNFDEKKNENLLWLKGLTSMAVPEETSELKDIEYTEATAKFFVDMIKSVCQLNEKIKDVLDPESIQKLVDGKMKLLG